MITPKMLERWRRAKVLSITNPNTDVEVCIMLEEMFIEVKNLRRINLKLLNAESLQTKLLEYLAKSLSEHYLSADLETIAEEVEELCKQLGLDPGFQL